MKGLRFGRGLLPVDAALWATVLALTVVFFVLLLHNLGALSLWMDEGFHSLASQSIRQHGTPLFPSGHVYYKAILYTYVLALISAVFGQNEFTLRIVSLLAVAASLPLLFHMVKKYFSRWAALAAVVILALSPWEAENARLALYFAPLQLFYLLGLFFFHKGFFEDEGRSRWLAVLLFTLAPQVHQLGMGLWFCFPALLFLRGLRRFLKKEVLLPFGVVTVFYVLMQLHEFFFWKVGYVYFKADATLRGMAEYFFSGFSIAYFKEFFRSFPWMSLTVLGGLFLCLGARRMAAGGEEDEAVLFRERWLFFNMNLFFPLLFLGFFRTHVQPRYLFPLYALFVILFCLSLLLLARIFVEEFLWPFFPGLRRGKVTRPLGLVLFGLLSFIFTDNLGLARVRAIVERRYGDAVATEIITRSGRFEHYDHRGVGRYVQHFLRNDDIVIAIHVVFGYVYAGRVDYWLWSGGPGTWDAWEKTADGWRDFYVGARWLNNLDDLKKIVQENPGRRVWLIASPSLQRRDHISQDIADFIQSEPERLIFRGKDGMSGVYLWNEQPALLTAERHTVEGEWLPASSAVVEYGEAYSKMAALLLKPGRGKSRDVFGCRMEETWTAGRYTLEFKLAPAGGKALSAEAGLPGKAAPDAAKILGVTVMEQKSGEKLRTLFLSAGQERAVVDFVLPRDSSLKLEFVYSGEAPVVIDWIDIRRAVEEKGGKKRR